MNSLVPYDGNSQHPVAQDPGRLLPQPASLPIDVPTKYLKHYEKETRIQALTALSAFELSAATAWLNNRMPGEDGVTIDLGAKSWERGLFGRGESIRARLAISIHYRR